MSENPTHNFSNKAKEIIKMLYDFFIHYCNLYEEYTN